MEKRFTLDVLGQIYALSASDKHPGTFNFVFRLKESVNSEILQQASNDLFSRLPFLNGHLTNDSKNYFYELYDKPPKIQPDKDVQTFGMYYNEGEGHVLRVLFGKKHIKVEASHFITDGRGLQKIASALIVRYFELLGVETDKTDIIDCSGTFYQEEMEDAIERFSTTQNFPKPKKEPKKVYKQEHIKSATTWTATQTFNAEKIKADAKSCGATITEYVLAHLFMAVAKERNAVKNKKAIVASVPVDCRSFLATQTVRNFVGGKNIIMPETSDFSDMIRQIKSQFAEINPDFVQNHVNTMKKASDGLQKAPIWMGKIVLKFVKRAKTRGVTTIFSNIGLVKLPKKIEEQIDLLEFFVAPEQYLPYSFSCVALGNTFSLSASVTIEDSGIIKNLFESLNNNS